MTTSCSAPPPQPLSVALAVLRYFPHGGLQRIALGVATALAERGHRVRFFTQTWDGAQPASDSIAIECIPGRGVSNHRRARSFAAQLGEALKKAPADVVLGFDRLPGLDLYFAGDPCYSGRLRRERPRLARWTPRARAFLELERAVFAPEAQTRILLMNPGEAAIIQAEYGTPDDRFRSLPAGFMASPIDAALVSPTAPAERTECREAERSEYREAARRRIRGELGLSESRCLLALGSDFHRKGFDRAVRALAAARAGGHAADLLIAGADRPRDLIQLSRSLGVDKHVRCLGPRGDARDLFAAADLLVHPARSEPAGMVILEALASGCPVLTTAVTGYAEHVARARAGAVLGEPFDQAELDQALIELLNEPSDESRRRAYEYASALDPDAMQSAVVDEVESCLRNAR